MNDFHQNTRRPHLTKEYRLPYCFKEVEKVLRTAKKCEANAKTILHNSKLHRNVLNKVYALTFNVLKKGRLLNGIIQEIKLFDKEPSMRKELAEILIHELIFGKGLPGKSKPIETIQKYKLEIERAYNRLSSEGNLGDNDFLLLPKYVRINTLATSMSEVLEDLEYLGFEQVHFDDSISDDEYFKLVKNVKGKTFLIDYHFKDLLVFHSEEKVTQWSFYQKGFVFLQDKSSFIPAHVLAPTPGSIVLDACAAPGMKTLHLAACLQNMGTLYAFERDENRFEILKKMLNSGHAEIFQTFCEDFNSVDVNDEKFSLVEYILLDPSCSGSGMVSRIDSATDTEQSKNYDRIQKLAGFQIILLKHALLFPQVKRIVYSTCSITEEENEYVVHEALNKFNHKFKLVHILPSWPIRGSEKYEFGHLCVRAFPEKSITNGFFVAMFERIECFDQQNNVLTKKAKKHKNKKQSNNILNSDSCLQYESIDNFYGSNNNCEEQKDIFISKKQKDCCDNQVKSEDISSNENQNSTKKHKRKKVNIDELDCAMEYGETYNQNIKNANTKYNIHKNVSEDIIINNECSFKKQRIECFDEQNNVLTKKAKKHKNKKQSNNILNSDNFMQYESIDNFHGSNNICEAQNDIFISKKQKDCYANQFKSENISLNENKNSSKHKRKKGNINEIDCVTEYKETYNQNIRNINTKEYNISNECSFQKQKIKEAKSADFDKEKQMNNKINLSSSENIMNDKQLKKSKVKKDKNLEKVNQEISLRKQEKYNVTQDISEHTSSTIHNRIKEEKTKLNFSEGISNAISAQCIKKKCKEQSIDGIDKGNNFEVKEKKCKKKKEKT